MAGSALIWIGIVLFILAIIVIAVGIYVLYKEKNPPSSVTTTPSDDLGWGIILTGTSLLFIGIIVGIVGYMRPRREKGAKVGKVTTVKEVGSTMV